MRLLPFYLFTILLFLEACTSIDCPVQNLVYTNYALNDVHIEGSWEFKVCCTDGTWYPGGTGNNCTLPTGNYNLFLYPEYHAYGDALADCIQYIQLL